LIGVSEQLDLFDRAGLIGRYAGRQVVANRGRYVQCQALGGMLIGGQPAGGTSQTKNASVSRSKTVANIRAMGRFCLAKGWR
jgi:hypothetical protein